MVIYFTGTGNSRFLARRLGEALGEQPLDAVACIRAGETPDLPSDTPYVFVAPTYAWRLPEVFTHWLGQCRLSRGREAYWVMNCGSGIGAADRYNRQLSADLGLAHRGTAKILMPENYIALFSAPDEGETAAILARARVEADTLAGRIRRGETLGQKPLTPLDTLLSTAVNRNFCRTAIRDKKFFATDDCISCGKCEAACMLHNVKLAEGRPVWGGNCTHCMACICGCPAQAIEYGRHTKGLRRYICPED